MLEVDRAAQAFVPPSAGPGVFCRRLAGDGNCFFRGMSCRQFGTEVLHLHIRLHMLAHLFLEHRQYVSSLKWHKYDQFEQVARDEAQSVLAFWGCQYPSESKLLMHLSELYAVCEPRVYCSPLLRQGCCNALTMEIQIVHPLAQLPAARDLRCYYCPLLCPYFNGEAVRSPKRCTMMWTVSTCDIVRDIRIMAALDEYVDFNH